MCILFVQTDPKPPVGGYRLIVASNRDEFYKRPAIKAFDCPETRIIGGRDMEPGREGGMWLGLSTKSTIKFGALLSVTGEEVKPEGLGRGPLLYDYLKTADSALKYISELKTDHLYNPFNLCMFEISKNDCQGYVHSNAPHATVEYYGKQILGIGNSPPNAPFAKVKKGRTKFEEAIKGARDKSDLVDRLLTLLKCQDLHLPDPELEKKAFSRVNCMSSIFMKIRDVYGTRSHSIVLVDDGFNVDFVEYTMKEPIDGNNPVWETTVINSGL